VTTTRHHTRPYLGTKLGLVSAECALDADSRQPGRVMRFQITVNGAPAGGASLVIDPETGEPLQRTQRVAFPGGEMRVLERYEATVVPATR